MAVKYGPRTIFFIVGFCCVLISLVVMLVYISNAAKRTYIDLQAEYAEIMVGREAVGSLVDTDFYPPLTPATETKLQEFIDRIHSSGDVLRVVIWDKEGAVLLTSGPSTTTDPEIISRALSGAEERISVHTKVNGSELLTVYIPIRANGKMIGVVEVEQRLVVIDVVLEQLRRHLWSVVLVLLPLLLFIIWFGFYGSIRKLEQRQRALDKLNEEYKERQTMLTEANERLVRLDKLKDEMLSNTSHEFRTPLAAIKMSAESLVDGGMGPLNDEQKESARIIYEASSGLAETVNNLLDLSRLEAGSKLDIKPAAVAEIVTPVALQLKPLVPKQIELKVELGEGLPEVLCDLEHTKGVLRNLLGNALKFTKEGSISVVAAQEGNFVRFDVKDTGMGMKPDEVPKLFTRYYRTAESSGVQGTGLGLCIVKATIERQNGTVSVTSQYGKGSTFSFVLPIRS